MANDDAVPEKSMPDGSLGTLLADMERFRAELARELHGELGGALAAARMSLSALRRDANPDAAVLAQVDAQLAAAQAVKQRLVETLRPGLLDHFGVGVALAARCEAACREAGVSLATDVARDLPMLASDEAILLYRIGDAALTRMLRSKPRSLRLALGCVAGEIRLRISQEGASAALDQDAVIVGLGRWLAHLGGSLRIEGRDGALGVSASLPCP